MRARARARDPSQSETGPICTRSGSNLSKDNTRLNSLRHALERSEVSGSVICTCGRRFDNLGYLNEHALRALRSSSDARNDDSKKTEVRRQIDEIEYDASEREFWG